METPMDWNGSFYAVDIQEDEYWSEGYIYDKNSNETDSYLEKNESVSMIEYDWKKGDPAYVVYTHDAVSDAYALRHAVKCIFVAVYIAEIVFLL